MSEKQVYIVLYKARADRIDDLKSVLQRFFLAQAQ